MLDSLCIGETNVIVETFQLLPAALTSFDLAFLLSDTANSRLLPCASTKFTKLGIIPLQIKRCIGHCITELLNLTYLRSLELGCTSTVTQERNR